MQTALVVHGHFYQPPRENPWTEELSREPSAAPFHDWNERINVECYRPNGAARIVDESGRVVDIVNNYEHISFNVGPTLMSWLEAHAHETYRRILDGDRRGHGAIAQAYSHLILPLATERDVRTQIRWGLADFEHRFGRPAAGMWLPEAAVNDTVLRILVEEGVGFTVLAPGQAAPEHQPIDTARPYRWVHPEGGGSITIVFYDGALSHDIAFALPALPSEALIERVAGQLGLVTISTDGETFGHHHRWGERLLAYALGVNAARRNVDVTNLNTYLREHPALDEVEIVESSWSCAHGVARWREDCGCSAGGQMGWSQRWRTPLRRALDGLRDVATGVFERRGKAVLADPWAARDAYIGVLLGTRSRQDFARDHVIGDEVEAFTLLEAQRHAMAMYTSCGWFFNDLAGLETVQVLRYAARVVDLLVELGEPSPEAAFLDVLAEAESNVPTEGNGRRVWARHVVPARVDVSRAVAHLALVELLEGRPPSHPVGAFTVEVIQHERVSRGPTALSTGHLALTHRRTGRRSEMVYGAIHLGGLEVLVCCREAEPRRDERSFADVRDAFEAGQSVIRLLRILGDEFGPREFGLNAALPDAAEQILSTAARRLADRFAAAYQRLFDDHQTTLNALAAAGYHLPPELRAPGELALARRLEREVAAQRGSLNPADYDVAIAIAREARKGGLVIDTPEARETIGHLLERATEQAVASGLDDDVDRVVAVLRMSAEIGLTLDLERAQEHVHHALHARGTTPAISRLATAMNLAV